MYFVFNKNVDLKITYLFRTKIKYFKVCTVNRIIKQYRRNIDIVPINGGVRVASLITIDEQLQIKPRLLFTVCASRGLPLYLGITGVVFRYWPQ